MKVTQGLRKALIKLLEVEAYQAQALIEIIMEITGDPFSFILLCRNQSPAELYQGHFRVFAGQGISHEVPDRAYSP